MPYGVDKDIGGDSPTNDKWMEGCVSRVKKQGKDEGSAIAICKTTLKNKKKKNKSSYLEELETELFNLEIDAGIAEYDATRNTYIRKIMSILGIPFNVAEYIFNNELSKSKFDLEILKNTL